MITSRTSSKNAETQNRTADTAVFSRMLYQLSYLGREHNFTTWIVARQHRVGGEGLEPPTFGV